MSPHNKNRRGFTLIELLIVIAIIVVVTAILMPSLSAGRAGAGALACQANLRQWALAATLYAQSNEGFLPRRGQGAQPTLLIVRSEDWFNALPPMLGQESLVDLVESGRPPQPGDRTIWSCSRTTTGTFNYYFAYAMNMRLSTWQDPRPDRIDGVGPTDRQVFMSEGPGAYCSVLPASAPYSVIAPHREMANIAFLDGHVARFSAAYVGCGIGDLERNDILWRVPASSWAGPGS